MMVNEAEALLSEAWRARAELAERRILAIEEAMMVLVQAAVVRRKQVKSLPDVEVARIVTAMAYIIDWSMGQRGEVIPGGQREKLAAQPLSQVG